MGTIVEKKDEHILVCLSSSPTNKKIISTAAKMAAYFMPALLLYMYRQGQKPYQPIRRDWKLISGMRKNPVRKS